MSSPVVALAPFAVTSCKRATESRNVDVKLSNTPPYRAERVRGCATKGSVPHFRPGVAATSPGAR